MTVVAAPAPRLAVARDGVRRWLLAGAAAVAATVLVAVRDPHVPASYGLCPLHAATGLWCPACGALRATHDLAHLHLAAAWSENALWVALVPMVVAAWLVGLVGLVGLVSRSRGRPARPMPTWLGVVGMVVFVCFGVLRNLPAFAWLAPAR